METQHGSKNKIILITMLMKATLTSSLLKTSIMQVHIYHHKMHRLFLKYQKMVILNGLIYMAMETPSTAYMILL